MTTWQNILHNVTKLQLVNTNTHLTSTANDVVFSNISGISSVDEQYMQQGQRLESFPSKALKSFLRDLINEYADKDIEDGYSLFADRLYSHDRKIILSHLADSEDYEYYCSSPERLISGFAEHDKTIQRLLDDAANDVYHDDMESNNSHREDCYEMYLEDGLYE